uniref:Uncharacterized protein n=1 Tax=Echinococcus canadensis TaxID=519352 RepID=A0A915EYC9_9CEST
MGRGRRNSGHRNGTDDDVGCVTNRGSMEKGDIKEEDRQLNRNSAEYFNSLLAVDGITPALQCTTSTCKYETHQKTNR